jgi:hypothetical protein
MHTGLPLLNSYWLPLVDELRNFSESTQDIGLKDPEPSFY